MDDKRKQILVDYISYLYTTGRSYDSIGKYIKYVTDFLENSEEINRRGYFCIFSYTFLLVLYIIYNIVPFYKSPVGSWIKINKRVLDDVCF